MTPEERDRRRTDLIKAWRPVAHKHPALAELGFFTLIDLIDATLDSATPDRES